MPNLTKMHEITSQLNKAKGESKIVLWNNHKGQILKLPLTLYKTLPNSDTLTFTLDDNAKIIISEILQHTSHLRFYLSQGSFFFQVRKKYLTPTGVLGVHFPEVLLFLDRRSNERVSGRDDIQLEIPTTLEFNLFKKCYDLSLRGLSIICSKSEYNNFVEQEKISNLKITYKDMVITLDAFIHKILKIRPFQFENIPYAHKKISFKFEQLNDINKKQLETLLESLEQVT